MSFIPTNETVDSDAWLTLTKTRGLAYLSLGQITYPQSWIWMYSVQYNSCTDISAVCIQTRVKSTTETQGKGKVETHKKKKITYHVLKRKKKNTWLMFWYYLVCHVQWSKFIYFFPGKPSTAFTQVAVSFPLSCHHPGSLSSQVCLVVVDGLLI